MKPDLWVLETLLSVSLCFACRTALLGGMCRPLLNGFGSSVKSTQRLEEG